jgi:hypothetical protein
MKSVSLNYSSVLFFLGAFALHQYERNMLLACGLTNGNVVVKNGETNTKLKTFSINSRSTVKVGKIKEIKWYLFIIFYDNDYFEGPTFFILCIGSISKWDNGDV